MKTIYFTIESKLPISPIFNAVIEGIISKYVTKSLPKKKIPIPKENSTGKEIIEYRREYEAKCGDSIGTIVYKRLDLNPNKFGAEVQLSGFEERNEDFKNLVTRLEKISNRDIHFLFEIIAEHKNNPPPVHQE